MLLHFRQGSTLFTIKKEFLFAICFYYLSMSLLYKLLWIKHIIYNKNWTDRWDEFSKTYGFNQSHIPTVMSSSKPKSLFITSLFFPGHLLKQILCYYPIVSFWIKKFLLKPFSISLNLVEKQNILDIYIFSILEASFHHPPSHPLPQILSFAVREARGKLMIFKEGIAWWLFWWWHTRWENGRAGLIFFFFKSTK